MKEENAAPGGHPVVLYDGVCGFCNRVVRRTIRRDPDGLFRFAPLQSEPARAALARHGMALPAASSPDPGTFYLVLDWGAPGERLLARSDAVLFILRSLPRHSLAAGLYLLLPRFLRDALYNFVARHRYRWFGRYDACPLPRPEDRARFLEG